MNFMRFSKLAVMPVLGLVAASAAHAQQIGTYTGRTSDGSPVTITIAQDPNNTNLELKLLSFGLGMLCEKSKETLRDIGLGFNDGTDILGKKFSYASSNFSDIDLVTTMTFTGNSVKGKVGANLAAFNPAYGHTKLTKNLQACVSPNQPFTAKVSDPVMAHPVASAAMTLSDGRTTIRVGTVPSQ
jgi:hypothetical protein